MIHFHCSQHSPVVAICICRLRGIRKAGRSVCCLWLSDSGPGSGRETVGGRHRVVRQPLLCPHPYTLDGSPAQWTVDLEGNYQLYNITIYNREDSSGKLPVYQSILITTYNILFLSELYEIDSIGERNVGLSIFYPTTAESLLGLKYAMGPMAFSIHLSQMSINSFIFNKYATESHPLCSTTIDYWLAGRFWNKWINFEISYSTDFLQLNRGPAFVFLNCSMHIVTTYFKLETLLFEILV